MIRWLRTLWRKVWGRQKVALVWPVRYVSPEEIVRLYSTGVWLPSGVEYEKKPPSKGDTAFCVRGVQVPVREKQI